MLRKIGGLLDGASKTMADFSEAIQEKVSQAKAIQEATYPVHHDAYSEKLSIETALKMAKRQIELDEKMKDPLFRDGYEKLSRVLREGDATGSEEIERAERHIPVFERKTQHPDPKTEQAIKAKLDQMKEERAFFLQGAVSELRRDPVLARYFEEELKKLGGEKYMASLYEAGLGGGKA